MGQRLGNRLNRPSWFGDMEPEYEDMLEWMLVAKVKKPSPDREVPLHRYWIPGKLPSPHTMRAGVACQ
ncbi:MAG: hypothetical protein HQL75_15500 [Magnetococcales bacterium]|nr:hypothetical protein [Magnetococcales bacterium]